MRAKVAGENAVLEERLGSLGAGAISILMIRKLRYEGWNLERRNDAFWRLWWPLQLGGVLVTEDVTLRMRSERLYLIPPRTVFSTRLQQPFVAWQIHFSLQSAEILTSPGIHELEPLGAMSYLLDELFGMPQPAGQPAWEAHALIALTLRSAPPQLWPSDRRDPRVRRALGFMGEHFREKLALEDIARASGCSERTLLELFQAEVRQTPIQTLTAVRSDEASRLLAHTDLSVDEIAERCGFANRYYFSRVFKQATGESPAAFRAEARL